MTIQQAHAARERRTDSHHRAIGSDISTLTKTLQSHLGQALLAVIVDAQPRTIARWISGESMPSAATERLLRDVAQVFDVITTVDTPQVARAWFMGMNPQLDDNSPAEVLAENAGAARVVMGAARAYVAGG